MKIFLVFLLIFMIASNGSNAQSWSPVGNKIMTRWALDVDPANPLPGYPRPQMERSSWNNLNGLWDYAITDVNSGTFPSESDGQILVPFAIESALSGVGKTVGKDKTLWYKRAFKQSRPKKGNTLLLHFGGVDWRSEIFINGKSVLVHEGGFDPFSVDITEYLRSGNNQEIVVKVWDPSNDGPQPRGKQVKAPKGIWYTPVTGIWQTVWTEEVPASYINQVNQTPDVDNNRLFVSVAVANSQETDRVKVEAWDGSKLIGETTVQANRQGSIQFGQKVQSWSPDAPKLYDLKVTLLRGNKSVDEVKSYFAMRKISLKKDNKGISRLALNDEFLFQYGPLDQGWWPDGLYTAPTDEALLFDLVETKKMGFNMIRKHIKVEPSRWYRYCDSIGILVWQDMPSGDMGGAKWDNHPGQISGFNHDKIRTAESEEIYRREWKNIIDALRFFPSIVVWIPFNEHWGQFKTEEITEWTMQYDPTRLVNSASGGNFFNTGHILDIHNYPDPSMPDPAIFAGQNRALVLGEFGGLGLPLEGHTWQEKDNWGYQSFKNETELLNRYRRLMTDLKRLIPLGLSAGIYTQTTDVEVETNGVMTYDRKVIKMPEQELMKMHRELYETQIK